MGHLIQSTKDIQVLPDVPTSSLDIDEILFMPSGTPAYKDNSPIVSATDRCNMVKLAIKPFDYMSLSTIETDRPGNTYTADTLAQIYDSYKKNIFYNRCRFASLYSGLVSS